MKEEKNKKVKSISELMEEDQRTENIVLNKFRELNQNLINKAIEDNNLNLKELKEITKKIEAINKKILKLFLNDEDFAEFTKKGKLAFDMSYKTLSETQLQILKNLNEKFVSEKLLMTIPYLLNDIKTTEIESFQNDFAEMEKLSKEKETLKEIFNRIYDSIVETNKTISEVQEAMLVSIPTTKYEIQIPSIADEIESEWRTALNLSNEETLKTFEDIMSDTNKGIIDDFKLFKLEEKVESQYQIIIKFIDEGGKKIHCEFIKAMNFTQHILDISNPRIKQMEDEIEKLKQENKQLKQQEEITEIESFVPNVIDNMISFNDKLSNNFANLQNNKAIELANTGGKSKKLHNSTMKVLVENGELTYQKILEPFDKVILQAIYSITKKNPFFDIQMIKENISGNINRHRGNLDEDIEKSINKLRTTFIQIEIPSELTKTLKYDFEKGGIKEVILPLREFYVMKGGKRKSVFGFLAKSIYFEYEEARGQLITKDKKLLQGGIGNATKESCVLTDYISTRIKDMEKQKKSRKGNYIDTIKFDTIFDLIKSDEDNQLKEDSKRKKRQRTIKQVDTILSTYKNNKYIKSYEKQKDSFKIEVL